VFVVTADARGCEQTNRTPRKIPTDCESHRQNVGEKHGTMTQPAAAEMNALETASVASHSVLS